MRLTIILDHNDIGPQATVKQVIAELKSVFPSFAEIKVEGVGVEKIRGFEPVAEDMLQGDKNYILPTRATKGSAGYEFTCPITAEISPGEKIFFWTNVKTYMQPGEVFILHVRSSAGVKRDLQLGNTTGMIDHDYYDNPSTGGNIGISLRNVGNEKVKIVAGEKFIQGFFTNFLVADEDDVTAERIGGFGSTGN